MQFSSVNEIWGKKSKTFINQKIWYVHVDMNRFLQKHGQGLKEN